MSVPSDKIVSAAVNAANKSPCAKSKRGVVIWNKFGHIVSVGHNRQPYPFSCTGSAACRSLCRDLCIHAEAFALNELSTMEDNLEMLHVKTVEGSLVASGNPSCLPCSKAILHDGRVDGVWLLHESGWKRYRSEEFHILTIKNHSPEFLL